MWSIQILNCIIFNIKCFYNLMWTVFYKLSHIVRSICIEKKNNICCAFVYVWFKMKSKWLLHTHVNKQTKNVLFINKEGIYFWHAIIHDRGKTKCICSVYLEMKSHQNNVVECISHCIYIFICTSCTVN